MNDLPGMLVHIIWLVFIYMTAWFMLAFILKRRDIIDSAWGLGFILVAIAAYFQRNNDSLIALLSLALVALWGIRLFAHITSRNWKKKEDYRYTQLGDLSSIKHWLKTYTNVFLLQGLLMIAISLPVIAIMYANDTPIPVIGAIGLAMWLFGIIFEAIGDYQLRQFIKKGKKGVMNSGLWKYTRHPNYFGEITAWWGAAVVALAFGIWWGILGAFVITILITQISGIPLLEKRYAHDKTYQAYAAKTSKLVPLPPKQ